MATKNIDFETLKEICKYHKEGNECCEEDNFSCECNTSECPTWNDLNTSEAEL